MPTTSGRVRRGELWHKEGKIPGQKPVKKTGRVSPSGITKKRHRALEHLSHEVANIRRKDPTLYWQATVARKSVKRTMEGRAPNGPKACSAWCWRPVTSGEETDQTRPDQTDQTKPQNPPPPRAHRHCTGKRAPGAQEPRPTWKPKKEADKKVRVSWTSWWI